MFFNPKKKAAPSIRLYSQNALVYEGLLKDIPLKESVILEKSIQFFNDPEPCHIHRSAVRVRLTEELLRQLAVCDSPKACPLLEVYSDLPSIERFELILPENFTI